MRALKQSRQPLKTPQKNTTETTGGGCHCLWLHSRCAYSLYRVIYALNALLLLL